MIHLDDVTFERQDRTIIYPLQWQMKAGEHWTILGRNGSGKSTLLEMILGYHFPTSGKVRVLGHTYGRCDVREIRKQIGYISQSLVEKLTMRDPVWEIVATGMQAHLRLFDKETDILKERAVEQLRMVRLAHLAEQSFGLCSQGERKKILLARVMMNNPKLLVMDEACAGLDLYEREMWLTDLSNLLANDVHLVHVTHHLEEIVPLFTHVALLHKGKLVAAGPKEEVLSPEKLSKTFDLPIAVNWMDGRPWARIKS
ncbi:ABC transporter ATP-binding protein [Paenibacillus agilis]|uniref:ATP-binding cassette domain-containing protein n=1 Tax=Paenibacillus agilis TaxID=3020863 RepID=A0A559IZP0_9BACL|nr:ATP-binding cassette domain-containing protein [Paenibacillus agilis]TVX93096.1 ATP-binding cassette domain-containing protein [Paenibacillus agilis]